MTKFRLLLLVMLVSLFMLGVGLYHRQNIMAAVGISSANECEVASGCARCGDGQCQKSCGETKRTCPQDCGGVVTSAAGAACGKCGDGVCVKRCGETAKTCPADCGGSPISSTESAPSAAQ